MNLLNFIHPIIQINLFLRLTLILLAKLRVVKDNFIKESKKIQITLLNRFHPHNYQLNNFLCRISQL